MCPLPGPICIQHTKHSKANIFQLSSQILARFLKKELTTNICQLSSQILARFQKVKQLTITINWAANMFHNQRRFERCTSCGNIFHQMLQTPLFSGRWTSDYIHVAMKNIGQEPEMPKLEWFCLLQVLLFWMAVFLTPWTASSPVVSLVGCSE